MDRHGRLEDEDIERLITEIKDYQITHGCLLKLVRYEGISTVQARPLGVSVVPTSFSPQAFDEAKLLQLCMNELYVQASCDENWLLGIFRPLLKHDKLLSSLWDIYSKVKAAGVIQDIVCGIFRSDYMLHVPHESSPAVIKQVEMNAFSVAGACHAHTVVRMHQQVRRQQSITGDHRLPRNNNIESIVSVLAASHHIYYPKADVTCCILMVVQPENFNIADERPIEYGLWDRNIPCFRCEWKSIVSCTEVTSDRTLLFTPPGRISQYEVSVIYYRAGYEAAEYNDEGQQTRLRLELSNSIKCPDILTHLTTFKTVQQALTQPGAVERFLPSRAESVLETFMPIYSLSDPKAQAIATTSPTNYVLKPNREGGGNNIYGSDIPAFLSNLPKSEWPNYILMQLMEPPPEEGILMIPSEDEVYRGPVVSELGILGTCIWQRDQMTGSAKILQNDLAGWTFKTKPAHVNEMSVVKGYGCFDCPDLF